MDSSKLFITFFVQGSRLKKTSKKMIKFLFFIVFIFPCMSFFHDIFNVLHVNIYQPEYCYAEEVHVNNEIQITNNNSHAYRPMVQRYDDHVYIAWDDDQTGTREIYFTASQDGGTSWGSRRMLTSVDGKPSQSPALHVDHNGNLHLAWRDKRGGTWSGWYMKSTNHGQSWTSPVNVTQYPDSFEFTHPKIAMTSDANNLYMFWHDNRDSGWHNPYYCISPNLGASWGTISRLTTERISGEDVSVSTDGQGTLHVGWRWSYGNQEGSMYKRGTNFGGTWENDITLGNEPKSTKPCANTAGHVSMIYPQAGKLFSVYSSNQGQSTSGPTIISNQVKDPSLSANNGAVDCQGSHFYLAWTDKRHGPDNSEIYLANSVTNGQSWMEDQRISNASGSSIHAKLAACDDGAHIVWADNRDGDYEIFYTFAGKQSDQYSDELKANTIFDWMESLFPDILSPSPQTTYFVEGIYYRYYLDPNAFIATYLDYLWLIDSLLNVHNLGEVDYWFDYVMSLE